MKALEAGKHVLVEKPVSFREEEIQGMDQKAKEKGRGLHAWAQLSVSAGIGEDQTCNGRKKARDPDLSLSVGNLLYGSGIIPKIHRS